MDPDNCDDYPLVSEDVTEVHRCIHPSHVHPDTGRVTSMAWHYTKKPRHSSVYDGSRKSPQQAIDWHRDVNNREAAGVLTVSVSTIQGAEGVVYDSPDLGGGPESAHCHVCLDGLSRGKAHQAQVKFRAEGTYREL